MTCRGRHSDPLTAPASRSGVKVADKKQDTKQNQRRTDGGEAVVRESVEAVGTLAQQGADAFEQGAETVRRGTHTLADAQREFIQGAAQRFEDAGRKILGAWQQSADNLFALTAIPSPDRGFQELQHGAVGLVEGMIRSNLQAMQDLFRLADPTAVVDVQRRWAVEYLDALSQGSALAVRATRRAAEETLRPLEASIEQRRQARDGERQAGQPGGFRRDGKVGDVMSTGVRTVGPDEMVQQAARLMREQGIGALPVGEGDKLVGMLTDRDVAVRLVAEGRDPARTKVREVMTAGVSCVFEDDDLGRAAENMAEQQVRRLPVINRDKHLVGVLSLGDLALNGNQQWLAGRTLADIAQETGQHTQVAAE